MYQQIIAQQKEILYKLNKQKSLLSWLRLVLLLVAIYCFYLMLFNREGIYGFYALGLFIVFLIVVNFHSKKQEQVIYHQILKKINDDEVSFLNGQFHFDEGKEFLNPQHAFSYDLDLFGKNSIFQFLNRTGTSLGKNTLANRLQEIPTAEKISLKQKVIQELATKIEFRQHFQTLATIANTSDKETTAIKSWTQSLNDKPSKIFTVLAIALPSLFVLSLIASFLELHIVAGKLSLFFFSLNLFAVGAFTKYIFQEIGKSDKIASSIQQYAKMLRFFNDTNFESDYLKQIQNKLKNGNANANQALNDLSNIFEKLNTIANLFIFIALNGTFQYHFWVYKRLQNWKQKHLIFLWDWIEIIGEIEALNSLANFSYNNKEYVYPEVTSDKIHFENLGHPLLSKEKRVRNSIDFCDKQFVILTGSNMSGKSTFLRTVGINLVLSYVGAPVDCTTAQVFPLPLWVSMRLTDSLSDSESFFFAEVKRLKQIVTEAEKQQIFVLLDEILKGTNSDDKKSGTIGVIEKLHHLNVLGMIATHDLEVCETTYKYPQSMHNKCFEVEIISNELHFDYKLKDGVCQNKNATFIMKKMKII